MLECVRGSFLLVGWKKNGRTHYTAEYTTKPKSKRSQQKLSATCNNLSRPSFFLRIRYTNDLDRIFLPDVMPVEKGLPARLRTFGFDFSAAVFFYF